MISELWCDAITVAELTEVAAIYSGFPARSLQARELAADVLGDAFGGDLACASDDLEGLRGELAAHVKDRARRARRGGRHAALPIEVAPPSALISSPTVDDQAETMEDVLQAVGVRARDDLLAWRLLDVYEETIALGQVPCRREAMRRGMTDWSFRRARERLAEYAQDALDDLDAADVADSDVGVSDTD